jgi:hypothetical protein
MHGISFLVTFYILKKVSDSFFKLNAFLFKMLTYKYRLMDANLLQTFASLCIPALLLR